MKHSNYSISIKENLLKRKSSPFSLGHRAKRLIWSVVYTIFFRTSPRVFHFWRVFLLQVFGAKIGKGCHVYPGVKVWAPWNLSVGNFVGIGDGVNLYCMDHMDIGDYVVISQGAHLCGGTHDYNLPNFPLVIKPIVIGAHAWVCAEAFIHAGVKIPAGAVVGARAVVSSSLNLPWAVYAGNPSRRVGWRKQKDWL